MEKRLRRKRDKCRKAQVQMDPDADSPKPSLTLMRKLRSGLRELWRTADQVARAKAVATIEYEVEELDNIFAILVLGMFIGIASPPIQITLELLPLMENELGLMLDKVSTAHDPLGELFSVLSID